MQYKTPFAVFEQSFYTDSLLNQEVIYGAIENCMFQ